MADFGLRLHEGEMRYWAERYSYRGEEKVLEIGARVQSRGCYTRDDFRKLCRWKTPRSQPLCEANPEEFVQAVTRTALSTGCEQLRIEVLTLLRGVGWPTASALLRFGTGYEYPILDLRALRSLNAKLPQPCTFAFWWAYTRYCRRLAQRCRVDLRVLDRALWQFDKESQGQ